MAQVKLPQMGVTLNQAYDKLREMQKSYWKDPEHTKRRIEAIKEGVRKSKLKSHT